MCAAAGGDSYYETAVSTTKIYGTSAFDVTFFMPYLPSCYGIAMLLKYIGIGRRVTFE
jgi:hypothetical protein